LEFREGRAFGRRERVRERNPHPCLKDKENWGSASI